MRKLTFMISLVLSVFVLQILMMNVTFAGSKSNVAIVMISDRQANVNIKNFFKPNKKRFSCKTATILSDKKIQSKFTDYCSSRVISLNKLPNEQDLIKFTSYAKCDKVVYLFVKEAESTFVRSESNVMINGTTTPKMTGVPQTYVVTYYLFDSSATVEAVLVDKGKIRKTMSSTKELKDYSDRFYMTLDKNSVGISAKEAAVTECIKDLSNKLKPLL